MSSDAQLCRTCQRPVTDPREEYERHEHRHWTCYHFAFWHPGDPDLPCQDPSCVWKHLRIYQRVLRQLGYDPEAIIRQEVRLVTG
jgi:hypothetical protein